MNESEYLLKKVEENERTVRELEPRLMAARKRVSLYRELYELETGKQAIQDGKYNKDNQRWCHH